MRYFFEEKEGFIKSIITGSYYDIQNATWRSLYLDYGYAKVVDFMPVHIMNMLNYFQL